MKAEALPALQSKVNKKLWKIVSEEYDIYPIGIQPLYPKVLVRVLPRYTTKSQGGIVLPETRNKPLHEGIIVKTWQPFWKHYEGKALHPTEEYPAEVVEKKIRMVSQLTPGDRVLFIHSSGYPTGKLDDREFRFLDEKHDILGKVEGNIQDVEDTIFEYLKSMGKVSFGTRELLKKFYIIEKDTELSTRY